MPREESAQPLLPSLLDRLLDNDPDQSSEPEWTRSQTLAELKESVKRDLEYLLNTRQTRPELVDSPSELARSVWTYGLPDFSHGAVGSQKERERLRWIIEETIRRFETRLSNVHVTMHPQENNFDRRMRLTVEGNLGAAPYIEAVAFDTVVAPTTGQCEVTSRD